MTALAADARVAPDAGLTPEANWKEIDTAGVSGEHISL